MSTFTRTRALLLSLSIFLGTGGALATSALMATPASALCATHSADGDWHNIDPNTRTVVHLANCGDQILCDTNGHCTGGQTTFSVHLWGKCHPTDCDWGTRTGYDAGDSWIRATYNFGF